MYNKISFLFGHFSPRRSRCPRTGLALLAYQHRLRVGVVGFTPVLHGTSSRNMKVCEMCLGIPALCAAGRENRLKVIWSRREPLCIFVTHGTLAYGRTLALFCPAPCQRGGGQVRRSVGLVQVGALFLRAWL